MKNIAYLLTIWCISIFTTFAQKAAPTIAQDSLRISLITCGPGEEVYSLYGHTAIRVQDIQTDEDYIFNYGLFNFHQKGFMWRFMLGKTDYYVGAESFERFYYSMLREGRAVYEQIIALTPAEAHQVFQALIDNCKEEGWIYRYNFLTDNCTTRAIEQIITAGIEKGGESVSFAPFDTNNKEQTYRKIIHHYAAEQMPWNCFGQDLLIGTPADTLLSPRASMSFPLIAMAAFAQGTIKDAAGRERPLVSRTLTLLDAPKSAQAATRWFTPTIGGLLLALGASLLSLRTRKGQKFIKRLGTCLDDALLLLQGTSGILIFLLVFFSVHPTVDKNWLILAINPIGLILLPYKIYADLKGKRSTIVAYFMMFSGLLLLAVRLLQSIPTAMIFVALAYIIRGWALHRDNLQTKTTAR